MKQTGMQGKHRKDESAQDYHNKLLLPSGLAGGEETGRDEQTGEVDCETRRLGQTKDAKQGPRTDLDGPTCMDVVREGGVLPGAEELRMRAVSIGLGRER